jgi:dihydrofolate reductase
LAVLSTSLDGYIADPNDEPGNPGGGGFDRLHEWFLTPDGEFFRPSGPAGQLVDEVNGTGAVLVGRRTAEQIDHGAVILQRPMAPRIPVGLIVTEVDARAFVDHVARRRAGFQRDRVR